MALVWFIFEREKRLIVTFYPPKKNNFVTNKILVENKICPLPIPFICWDFFSFFYYSFSLCLNLPFRSLQAHKLLHPIDEIVSILLLFALIPGVVKIPFHCQMQTHAAKRWRRKQLQRHDPLRDNIYFTILYSIQFRDFFSIIIYIYIILSFYTTFSKSSTPA